MASETASAEVMSKIAGKFGFPGGEPAPVVTDDGGEQTGGEVETTDEGEPLIENDGLFALEWEGQTLRLPQTLKDAVMRTEDYTKKTQALADERRGVEQIKSVAEAQRMESAFVNSIAAEQQELGIIDAYLKQAATTDWSQMPTDQLLRQKIELDAIKERRTAINDSINGKRSKFSQDMQAKITDLRGKAREIASKSIQGFGEQTEKTMRDYAKSEGFTDHEIDNVLLDPRSFKTIWKAAQFDAIKAGTAKAGEQAKRADKGVLRPGVAGQRMPSDTANKLNYGKAMKAANTSGEKARVIEQRLAGVFSKGKG